MTTVVASETDAQVALLRQTHEAHDLLRKLNELLAVIPQQSVLDTLVCPNVRLHILIWVRERPHEAIQVFRIGSNDRTLFQI